MKKLKTFFFAVICLFCLCFGVACIHQNPTDSSSDIPTESSSDIPTDSSSDETNSAWNSSDEQPNSAWSQAKFTVHYDYGIHIQTSTGVPMVTMLLGGNEFFFDPYDYGIDMPLLAGEELTVYFTGEMVIAESYPGIVHIQDGEIKQVKKTQSGILQPLTYTGGKLYIDGFEIFNPPQYVINADKTFCDLSTIADGMQLYGAYLVHDGGMQEDIAFLSQEITALYSYVPGYETPSQLLFPHIAELSAQDVVKMEYSFANYSVGPGSFIIYECTSEQEQIQSVLACLQNNKFKRVSRLQAEIDGGLSQKCVFYTQDQEYAYSVYAGYVQVQGAYYKPQNPLPALTNTRKEYQMNSYHPTFSYYRNGDFVGEYNNILKDVRFQVCVCTEEITIPQTKHVVEEDGVRLILLDARHFFLEGYYHISSEFCYEIIGETDFSFLFDEDNRQYRLELVGNNNALYCKPNASYYVGEEVKVAADILLDACTVLYLNGEYLGFGEEEELDGVPCNVWTFEMPQRDSVLFVSVEEGMLPAVETMPVARTEYVQTYSLIEEESFVTCISTKGELFDFCNQRSGDEFSDFYRVEQSLDKYDDSYFHKNNLIIVGFTAGSTSYRYQLKSIEIAFTQDYNNHVIVTIEDISPSTGEGDCQVGQWYVLIEVAKYNRYENAVFEYGILVPERG